MKFPCEVLSADICFGTYYCACQNGFWRETYGISKEHRLELLAETKANQEEKGRQKGSNELDVLKGASISIVVALVVCSAPCICAVIYFRKRRLSSEVELFDLADLDLQI